MRDRTTILQIHHNNVLLGVGLRFSHCLLNIQSFSDADTHASFFIAQNKRCAETEPLAARDHTRHAAHIQNALLEFFFYFWPIGSAFPSLSLLHVFVISLVLLFVHLPQMP